MVWATTSLAPTMTLPVSASMAREADPASWTVAAVQAGVRMPSFFGYMLWSSAILLPLFALLTFVFLR